VVTTAVELLSVSIDELPETHTGPANVEPAVGPLSSSLNQRRDWLFTRAERPEVEAAPTVELRTFTTMFKGRYFTGTETIFIGAITS
jgi:hypothetical protein